MIARYAHWLHTRWPAGTVEKLPLVEPDGTTALPVVRDLAGIPLLKFAVDAGARAIQAILAEEEFLKRKSRSNELLDVAIIGAGVSGLSAAIEAKKEGLRFAIYEATQDLNTLHGFPQAKPIYTYPTEMVPKGDLTVSANVKEALIEELQEQRKKAGIETTKASAERIERSGGELVVHFSDGKPQRALRVIVAIGRTGNYRPLGVPGETLDKVYQRLFDPKDQAGKRALVVGGGDSALETAIALARSGARVTLSCRSKTLSRPKPENLETLQSLTAVGTIKLMLGSRLKRIDELDVQILDGDGQLQTIGNDVVFSMIGREAPLGFFRRSGIPIRGEWRLSTIATFVAFFLFCLFLYSWKAGTRLNQYFSDHHLFPFNLPESLGHSGVARTLAVSLRQPGFYYSLAYTVCILLFGWKRIRRRKTPYVTRQTLSLAAFQVFPLFLLPYFILPLLGYAGAFDSGVGKTIADNLFPVANYDYGREYWRAFGLILAWPLFFWNLFTSKPMGWWLIISLIQTFVLIPLLVRRYGKGAYCGWICSCGALAETMGDTQRSKMPHGPIWNRLNMVGQAILLIALILFAARVVSWYWPGSAIGMRLSAFYENAFYSHSIYDYYHVVDIFLAGVVGVGMYFWFSGRVWCRFACPLAALMHIYARFTRFRIFADKKKCISCNVCTSVCHQGIDVMGFANKGSPMEDPECVRCSACVQSCPTGTLTFGRLIDGKPI